MSQLCLCCAALAKHNHSQAMLIHVTITVAGYFTAEDIHYVIFMG